MEAAPHRFDSPDSPDTGEPPAAAAPPPDFAAAVAAAAERATRAAAAAAATAAPRLPVAAPAPDAVAPSEPAAEPTLAPQLGSDPTEVAEVRPAVAVASELAPVAQPEPNLGSDLDLSVAAPEPARVDMGSDPARPVEPAPAPAAEDATLLGQVLLRAAAIDEAQLRDALAQQGEHGGRLGEILVARGWLSTADLARALAEQQGLEYVDLKDVEVQPEAAGLVVGTFARRFHALPVRFVDDGTVLVALADPTDLSVRDDVRLAVGHATRFGVADARVLEATIARQYRVEFTIQESSELETGSDLQEVFDDPTTTAPTIELVDSLISRAIEEGASDLHFDAESRELVIRARIDGVLRRIATISNAMRPAVISRLKVMGALDIAEKRLPQDGSFSIRYAGNPVDVRVAVVPTKHGEHIVLRILHRATKLRLPELGMSPEAEDVFVRAIRQPYGAVLTCGPTGSGKTTTLYAALDMLNEEGRAIATIEDPVEYQMPGVQQVEVHSKIGLTFARGLRTILRADPDVLLVGEVRDEETAKIAIQAALTGHLLLTTLHTNDAAGSIARLKDIGVHPGLLAASINCIVAQRLARRLCTVCREEYTATAEELGAWGLAGTGTLFRGRGCQQCSGTGYRGRIALYELLPVHGRVRTLIEAPTEEIHAAALEQGMVTMRDDGLRQAVAGVTSLDELRRVIGDRR